MSSIAAYNLVPDGDALIPRFREAGDLTLDLFHRDGRVVDRWLGLHPREFELLWRLADEPRVTLSREQLLADVWRIMYEPETNSVAVHVARVRSKLAAFDLAHILVTDESGYFLDVPAEPGVFEFSKETQEPDEAEAQSQDESEVSDKR